MSPHEASADLLHPELRQYLAHYLRSRLPPAEVDDALQAVYCAALEARSVPQDHVHLRRWMTVIARRQVAAYYERTSAEQLGEPPEVEVQEPKLLETMSLLRWAEQQAAHSKLESVDETLDWMVRESDGEKLEAIAADTRIPSARVRQRVFRLRRFMKARWALEISAAVVLVAMTSWVLSRRTPPVTNIDAIPIPTPPVSIVRPMPSANDPPPRAAEIRQRALRHCDQHEFEMCLQMLDEAATLDPKGDADSTVVAARKRAAERLAKPMPAPPTSTSVRKGPRTTTPTLTSTSRAPFSPSSGP